MKAYARDALVALLVIVALWGVGIGRARGTEPGYYTIDELYQYGDRPEPTRTRIVTRPTASPIPGYEPLAIVTDGPLYRPGSGERAVILTTTLMAIDPEVVRATLFVFPPGVTPNSQGTGTTCRKGTTRLRDRATRASTPQVIRCAFNWKVPVGVWRICGHIPNEPGAAWNDYLLCVPFEVR